MTNQGIILMIAFLLPQDGSIAMQPLIRPRCGQIIKDGQPQQECQEAIVMVGTIVPIDPGIPASLVMPRIFKFQHF